MHVVLVLVAQDPSAKPTSKCVVRYKHHWRGTKLHAGSEEKGIGKVSHVCVIQYLLAALIHPLLFFMLASHAASAILTVTRTRAPWSQQSSSEKPRARGPWGSLSPHLGELGGGS